MGVCWLGRCRLVGVAYTERWGGARGRWAWPCWPWKTWKVRLRSLGLTLPGVLGSWGEGSRQRQALVGFRL